MQQHSNNVDFDFDFDGDVIGDDLVVGGVAYDSSEWVADAEDGVRRRTETVTDEATEPAVTMADHEARLADDFRARAAQVGADYATLSVDMSAGPTLSELMSRYKALLDEADDAGFDCGLIRDIVDATFHAKQ